MTTPTPDWTHHHAKINGINMHYVEQGEGVPVVLCHGFPHLWFSWHRQIPVLAAAGYRVIAPDMRGMGQTDAPDEVEAYDTLHCVADLVGLLDHLDIEKAVFSGLDFGVFTCYELALRHPERVMAVIGLENPAAPFDPDESPLTGYRKMGEQHFLHIEYFREPGRSDRELADNTRNFLHKVYWTLSGNVDFFKMFEYPPGTSYYDAMEEAPPLPWPWLSQLEFEFFVSEYSRSGFTGGLNWYRSMDLKWQQHKPFANVESQVPAYFIGSDGDVDLEGFHGDNPIALLKAQFPDLRRVEMIPEAGHMIHFEATGELNSLLLEYLADIVARG